MKKDFIEKELKSAEDGLFYQILALQSFIVKMNVFKDDFFEVYEELQTVKEELIEAESDIEELQKQILILEKQVEIFRRREKTSVLKKKKNS